jgi:hypothetical protein
MLLSYPSKGKISTCHQVQLYQTINALACPENIEQLPKIFWSRITGEHNRIHGCQRFLTTIDCFSDMLSTILQKEQWHYGDVDKSRKCWYLSMSFQELQYAQKPDDPRQ